MSFRIKSNHSISASRLSETAPDIDDDVLYKAKLDIDKSNHKLKERYSRCQKTAPLLIYYRKKLLKDEIPYEKETIVYDNILKTWKVVKVKET